MKQELTEAQQKALDLTRNISVTAGAGSGKTKILVDRFLKIVLQDAGKTRRILAITFTNKAAGEMRERIAANVVERLSRTNDARQAANLRRIRDQLNSAALSTFHSFCARVLREFPLQAGLTPEFTEMDEIRSFILRREAVSRVFQSLERDDTSTWIDLFSRLNHHKTTEMLMAALAKPYEMRKIQRLFTAFSAQEYLTFLHNQWLFLIEPQLSALNVADFAAKVRETLQTIPETWGWPTDKAAAVFHQLRAFDESYTRAPGSQDTLRHLTALIALLTTGENGTAYKNLGYLGKTQSWPSHAKPLLLELSRRSALVAEPLKKNGLLYGYQEKDREWLEVFGLFLRLYEKTAAQYEVMKKNESGVDFDDLQIKTLQLLTDHEDIRQELNRRFDFIMVDEFQDTDDLQWQILKKLAAGPDGQIAPDKIFVVGDPKQSIYGFRNADIRIFKKVKEEFAALAGASGPEDYSGNVVFKESFRFLPRVNGFINRIFSRILTENVRNPYEVGYHALETRRNLPGKGDVTLTLLNDQEEADYIAWQIERLVAEERTCYEWQGQETERPLKYGDMAVLIRQHKDLLPVEQALRNRGIPFKTAKGIGFWQKQEIFDIYHLLRFLQNPQDDFALIAILRSAFFMFSDEWLFFLAGEPGTHYLDKLRHAADTCPAWCSGPALERVARASRLLDRWRGLRDRISQEELLQTIMEDSHFRELQASQLNGEQAVANVEKLILQAHHFDLSGPAGLTEFLAHLTDLIEEEMKEGEAQIAIEDDTTVKLMTIHAAKGLQFPVVFLPFLHTQVGSKRNNVFMDSEIGMATTFESLHNSGQEPLMLRLLKDRQRRKELAEARRLFYVAVTRASNYLFLSATLKENQQPKENSALNWLREALIPDGIDIINPALDADENSELRVLRGFEEAQQAESGLEMWLTQLEELPRQAKESAPEQELPVFLKPVQVTSGAQVFSATRIMTFLENPDEYYCRYHLGFFEHDYQTYGELIYPADDALLWGKVVHRFFQLWAEQGQADSDLIDSIFYDFDIFEPPTQQRFTENLKELKNKVERSEQARRIVFAAKGCSEQSVLMRLGDDYFTGTIDRMFLNDQGDCEIVDYKTNRIPASRIPEHAAKYEWQMKSYALLLSRLYPDQKAFPVSLYFLHPDRMHRKTFHRNEIAQIADEIQKIIAEIKRTFPIGE